MKSVLIANRGEIAVRIARTCREMGIRTIAVYSDVDKNSLHVTEADSAYSLGGATPAESYLSQEKLIGIAEHCGAEAIHPGYGFLSENAAFADRVVKAGLIWIGPPASAIQAMGSKTEARALMISANVPVVPGTQTAVETADEALGFAREFGYPVLLKAAAGGGGKGMRVVREEQDLETALAAAQREALSAFGNGSVYVEKYLERPKHVEVQIFADSYGNAVYLGERECSLQRRHQKIIEEAPSAAVSPSLRMKIGETAVMAAKACGYVNAGTCEFLLDRNGEYYFLEMNTRLQVEHAVTEMVTGIDLVRLQIETARGQKLPYTQSEVSLRGHAIEVRIYAEDVLAGFLPSTGTLEVWRPPSGPGLREDSAMYEGAEISRHYDPMISKLIAYGETREAAIQRMRRALNEYFIAGVMNNVGFCNFVLQREEFRTAAFDTGSVEREFLPDYREYTRETVDLPDWVPAAIALANKAYRTEAAHPYAVKSIEARNDWKITGRKRALRS